MSPISYAGKTRDSSMARELYALTFDLDGLISTDKSPYSGIKEHFFGRLRILIIVFLSLRMLFPVVLDFICTMFLRSRFHYLGMFWNSWKSINES